MEPLSGGIEIKALLADQIKVEHPEILGLDEVDVMFRDGDRLFLR